MGAGRPAEYLCARPQSRVPDLRGGAGLPARHHATSSAACARPIIPAIPIAATRPSRRCRPRSISAWPNSFELHTPLMWLDKAATWKLAHELGGAGLVDLIREHSHTCYLGERGAQHDWGYGCGECPACSLRAKGWREYVAEVMPHSAITARVLRMIKYSRPACREAGSGFSHARGMTEYLDGGQLKILRLQLDRLAVRRAVGGVVPGIAVARAASPASATPFSATMRSSVAEPVAVIGLAGIGIAGRLRALDLVAERRRPFGPGEHAALVQRQRHGEGLRLPRLAEHRAVVVARNARDGRRRARAAAGSMRQSRRLQIGLERVDRDLRASDRRPRPTARGRRTRRCRAIAGSRRAPIAAESGNTWQPWIALDHADMAAHVARQPRMRRRDGCSSRARGRPP